jgi:predicted RNase H-like nuclease (RuvC/YqgF family)
MDIDPRVQQRDIEYLSKAIEDLSMAMARLEGKIDGMTQSYARKTEVDKEHLRLEEKITQLEVKTEERFKAAHKEIEQNTNWRWKMVGLGVAATLVIPILTALVLRAI